MSDGTERQGSSKEWVYCPECGSDEIHYEEGRHKQCAECHQEWFSDIDYTNVVRANLNDMKKRLAPETSNAAKWLALRNCARITAIGCAGLTQPHNVDDDYAHLTLNFWTGIEDGDPGPAHAREWLDKFVAKALRAELKAAARQLCTQCTGWLDEHRHWCPSLLKPQCPWCGGEHVGTDCKAEKASAETKV